MNVSKEFCKRGHVLSAENVTKTGTCRICKNIHAKKYRERDNNNPAHVIKVKERMKAWSAENRPPKGKVFQEFCKWGHIRSPDNLGKKGECKLCKKLRNPKQKRKHYLSNKDKILAKNKEYRLKAAERIKRYRETFRDRRRLQARQWRDKLPDHYIAYLVKINVSDSKTGTMAELLELKRLTIQLQRRMNKCQNQLSQQQVN